MRFHITDPILKGILRCTNCVVAAEERIQKPSITSQPITSQTGASMETPSQQKSLSEGIIPDYTMYLLTHGLSDNRMPVIGIVEVKRKEDFNERAVCQTIGYHIVSRVTNAVGGTLVPPLLILLCQDKLKFIFLPFTSDGFHCIDAVVTPSINIFEQDSCLIDESWFVFACLYIMGSPREDLALMKGSEYQNLTLHMKKSYEDYMEPNVNDLTDELKIAEEARKKAEEARKKAEDDLQKVNEEASQLRTERQKLLQQLQQLKEQAGSKDTQAPKRPGKGQPPPSATKGKGGHK